MTKPNRRKEGAQIKRAVKAALPNAVIRTVSGKGTGWWHIYLEAPKIEDCTCTYEKCGVRNTCSNCKELYKTLTYLSELAICRSGVELSYFYDDNDTNRKIACVNVSIELTETVPLNKEQTRWQNV